VGDSATRRTVPGLESPCGPEVYALLRGAQHLRHEWPRQKSPLGAEQLHRVCEQLAGSGRPIDLRDRAILLLGFTTALRRSSLVELELADVTFSERGLTVHVQHEKQDQAGVGRLIGVPGGNGGLCAVKAVADWIGARGAWPGPLFVGFRGRQMRGRLSGWGVALIVKRCVELIGLDPQLYAGHSLRSGFITEALSRGLGDLVIAAHTGHRSLVTLRRYFRPADPFEANACAMMGL
jgi:integrase